MEYTIAIPERLYSELTAHIGRSKNEAAAYLLCRRSSTDREIRLLARRLLPVQPADILAASRTRMSIRSSSFMSAMKEADRSKSSFVFVHSHPDGPPTHSIQDDREEPSLFRTAYNRIGNSGPHASLVLSGTERLVGRVWNEDGTTSPLSTIRVVGQRLRFWHQGGAEVPADIFDRHVRAFGEALQPVLRRLNVGVVGCGGTGARLRASGAVPPAALSRAAKRLRKASSAGALWSAAYSG